jgi:hypothetical protein
VIRRRSSDACRWQWRSIILATDAAPPHRRGVAIPHVREHAMIRQQTVLEGDLDRNADDRSMRWVEYALAIVAIVAAGILAFVR